MSDVRALVMALRRERRRTVWRRSIRLFLLAVALGSFSVWLAR